MTGRPVGLHRAFNPIVGQFPHYMGVNPKNRGDFTTKMDGENFHGKPDEQMDDLGGFVPIFLGWHPHLFKTSSEFDISKDSG